MEINVECDQKQEHRRDTFIMFLYYENIKVLGTGTGMFLERGTWPRCSMFPSAKGMMCVVMTSISRSRGLKAIYVVVE